MGRRRVARFAAVALGATLEPRTSCSFNRAHGPPLAFGSCAPPVRTPGELTVGTLDANGLGPRSTSEVHLRVVPGIAKEGRRAIWELGQLAIHDGGGGVFMRQGVFVP